MAEYTSSIEEYNFNHRYRGQALIFIHEKFDDPKFLPRKGASLDEMKMRTLFKALDFRVRVYKDKTNVEIMEKLKKAAECKYNKDSDCFVCAISTHGGQFPEKDRKFNFTTWKDCVYGRDCTPILVENILKVFNKQNCPSLVDKPKFFFMQACRSRHEQGMAYDMGALITLIRQRSRDRRRGDNVDGIDELDEATRHMGLQETEGREPEDKASPHAGHQESVSQETGTSDDEIVDVYEGWSEDEDETPDGDGLPEGDMPVAGAGGGQPDGEDSPQPEGGVDETDPMAAGDSGTVPEVPMELNPIVCPDDCLIMYPVMPGRVALRSQTQGSWMLHYLHSNLQFVLRNSRLLPYLTKVIRDMGRHSYYPRPLNPDPILSPEDLVMTKVSAIIIHKLSKDVRFTPKLSNTLMAFLRKDLNFVQQLKCW